MSKAPLSFLVVGANWNRGIAVPNITMRILSPYNEATHQVTEAESTRTKILDVIAHLKIKFLSTYRATDENFLTANFSQTTVQIYPFC